MRTLLAATGALKRARHNDHEEGREAINTAGEGKCAKWAMSHRAIDRRARGEVIVWHWLSAARGCLGGESKCPCPQCTWPAADMPSERFTNCCKNPTKILGCRHPHLNQAFVQKTRGGGSLAGNWLAGGTGCRKAIRQKAPPFILKNKKSCKKWAFLAVLEVKKSPGFAPIARKLIQQPGLTRRPPKGPIEIPLADFGQTAVGTANPKSRHLI